MARAVNKLTAKAVASAKVPGYTGDGGGLWLQVSPSGSKSWVFRFASGLTEHGKPRTREMGLGPVHTIGLADARELALQCRRMLLEGRDPIEERNRDRTLRAETAAKPKPMTFAQAASALIEVKQHDWKNAKHASQWASTLETYAYPFMGTVPVAEVTREHVLAALRPIWSTKTETASRLRSRIELVLNYAQQQELRPDAPNPARWRGNLDGGALPKPSKVAKKKKHPTLPFAQICAFMRRLRTVDGQGARALEFAILTAARSVEVRGATWSEIDLEARIWSVPGERMKMGNEHRVPLSDAAIRLLRSLPKLADNDLLFPAPRGGQISDMTISAVCKRMNEADGGVWTDPKREGRWVVPHGFRSTFRDWAGDSTEFPRELAEHALAHQIGDQSEQAYRRSDALERRRPMMEAWAAHCDTPQHPATVRPIATAKRRKVTA